MSPATPALLISVLASSIWSLRSSTPSKSLCRLSFLSSQASNVCIISTVLLNMDGAIAASDPSNSTLFVCTFLLFAAAAAPAAIWSATASSKLDSSPSSAIPHPAHLQNSLVRSTRSLKKPELIRPAPCSGKKTIAPHHRTSGVRNQELAAMSTTVSCRVQLPLRILD